MKANLTCFCSIPFEATDVFVQEHIVRYFFENYKKELAAITREKFDGLFDPQLYYIWGKYDLCVISEIDNLEYASRFFKYSSEGKRTYGEIQNFDYKVTVGFDSLIEDNSGGVLPYIAIAQLKINSAFLISKGTNLLSRIKEFVVNNARNYFNSNKLNFNFTVNDSYSYHELTLVVKSNSIKALKEVILLLREAKLSDINLGDFSSDNFLFGHFYTENLSSIGNHIFESSFTTFGINYYLFNEDSFYNKKIIHPLENEIITLYSKWSIKPGHIHVVKQILDELSLIHTNAFEKYELISGKGDLLVKHRIVTGNNATNDFPRFLFNQAPQLKEHILETYTTVSFDTDYPLDNCNFSNHHSIHEKLNAYTIDKTVLEDVKVMLKSLWIPKTLSERVMRIIAAYNNAIMSPDMYVFYIEIFPFIQNSLINTIELYYQHRSDANFEFYNLKEALEKSCNEIESSFENRFYQSYWTSDLPETNTDFSGGMHNLISVYDSLFKALNNFFWGQPLSTSFLCVKSETQVRTSFDTLKVNYLHLVQPYNFCSIAFHETLNYAFEKHFMANNLSTDPEVQAFIGRYLKLLGNAGISLQVLYSEKNIDEYYASPPLFARDSQSYNELQLIEEELTSKSFVKFIDSNALRYFITDYLNFTYLYKGDYKLFCSTSWDIFVQSDYVYDAPEKINQPLFVTFAMRMAFVKLCILFKNKQPITLSSFDDIYGKNILGETALIEEYSLDVARLMKQLSKTKDFSDWVRLLLEVGEMGFVRFGIEREIKDKQEKNIQKYLHGKLSQEELLNQINSQDLYNTYLSILRSYLSLVNSKTKVLKRSPIGTQLAAEDGIYLDPLGGLFITGQSSRQLILDTSIMLYKLLFHFSCKFKFQYMKPEIIAKREYIINREA